VLRRFMEEISAGRFAADVITTSDPAAAARLAEQGIFVPFKPVNFDKVPAEVKDAQGRYVAQRLNMLGIIVRADKVPVPQRPKNWSDLVQPAYKGQMVMPDPAFTSLQLIVVATLSRKLGWDFYEGLKKNDIMIVEGHQQVADMLKRGERMIAAEGADSYAFLDRQVGHDEVTVFPAEGAFAIPSPTAIVKGSPHPNAAKAFLQFMLTDAAQKLFPEKGLYAARVDAPPPAGNPKLGDIKLMPVDYGDIEKNTVAIKEHFAEIFQ
jgi:iron(III) transport system substrate-binding protein